MKKLAKTILILTGIGAAVGGALLYLRKAGFCSCCDEDGECGHGCQNQASDDDEDTSFNSREYVSIQPKSSDHKAENTEADKVNTDNTEADKVNTDNAETDNAETSAGETTSDSEETDPVKAAEEATPGEEEKSEKSEN